VPRHWAMSLLTRTCNVAEVIRAIDYSALTGAVAPAEVKAFRDSVRARPGYSTTSAVITVIVALVVLFVFGSFFVGILGTAISWVSAGADNPVALVAGLFFPVVLLGGFVLLAVVVIRQVARGGRWERWYRLDRFAAANGFTFSPRDADPTYPGAIFQLGRSRTALDHLRSASDRFLDYGNYQYVTGSGKNQTTRTWGFLALQLDRALPNMVLDARANNGIFGTNLPATFRKDQVLSLEGDFDKYFTLYCPKEYERDALYVFTPDLMALLIDTASPYDVEIVDTWMFVYSSSPFDLRQPAVHQRLLGIVDTVGAKTLSQTDRYADERIGDPAVNLVAPQGRRLRRGVSVGAVIFVAVFAVVWLWPFLSGLIAGLAGR